MIGRSNSYYGVKSTSLKRPPKTQAFVCVFATRPRYSEIRSLYRPRPHASGMRVYISIGIYIYIYMHVFAFMNISCICFFCTPTWVHTYRPPKPRFQTATVVLAHALACSSLEGQQDTTKKKRKTQKRRKQDEGKQQKEHSEKERMRTRVSSCSLACYARFLSKIKGCSKLSHH